MPSHPEQETQPNRDLGQSSDSNNHPPPLGQPPLQSQQQSPGYLPVMGYPGYPNTYPTYPSPQYNNQYAYTQAPPLNYFGSPYPTHQNLGYYQPPPIGFLRGILSGVTILVILLCLSTLITWLIFRPQVPNFTLTHFAISDFNVTRPIFTAQWTMNLTIENSNSKLKAYFDRIQSFIYYQNPDGDNEFLSTAFFPPVYIDNGKMAEVGQRLTAGEKEQPMVPSWVVQEMKKEKATGTVTFSLRMVVSSNFKTKDMLMKKNELRVFCEKLKVAFEGNSGNGAVSLPKPLRCLVYV